MPSEPISQFISLSFIPTESSLIVLFTGASVVALISSSDGEANYLQSPVPRISNKSSHSDPRVSSTISNGISLTLFT